jgi:hypothetical protein
LTAEDLIALLKLEPLPDEGGYYRQSYVSTDRLPARTLDRFEGDKAASTAIYYLLSSSPDSFSALHRLPTDEVYHFYLGDPVEMLMLGPGGSERVVLGSDLLGGQRVQHVVPRGVWQGSRLLAGGRFALLGTTLAPGFDVEDLVLADREKLVRDFPETGELIRALTRFT